MISRFFRALGKDLKEIGLTFVEGDWATKLSFLIMGFGQLVRGQLVRGLTMLGLEGGILFYLINFGWSYLANILTLGTVETHRRAAKPSMATTAS
jgi:arabinogalactan oligomer/maltooligosaccharide transport system permease protein